MPFQSQIDQSTKATKNNTLNSHLQAGYALMHIPEYSECVDDRIASIVHAGNLLYKLILKDKRAELGAGITNYARDRKLVKNPVETLKYTVSNLVAHLAHVYEQRYHTNGHKYHTNGHKDVRLYMADLLKMAEGCQTMVKPRDHQYTKSRHESLTIIQHDSPLAPWSEDQLEALYQFINHQKSTNDALNLNYLDSLQQQLLHSYLKQYVQGASEKETIISRLSKLSIPSHLRHIVGLANHGYHQLAVTTTANTTYDYFAPQLRSAHPSHHALTKQVGDAALTQGWLKDNLLHTLVNALQNFDNETLTKRVHQGRLPFFVQTLTGRHFREDAGLDQDLQEVINDMSRYINAGQSTHGCRELPSLLKEHNISEVSFVTTSHPINLEGQIASDNSEAVITEINSMSDKLGAKSRAAYESLKDKPYSSNFQWLYRDIPYFSHLWSAALEQLVMKEIGITTGFCVSGKDRRAIVLMLTDALDIFYYRHERLPGFLTEGYEKDYDELAQLFAHLYCTRHHQYNSAYNATGVFAIKNAEMYLPYAFRQCIKQIVGKEDELTFEDKIASINDITKLYDSSYIHFEHLAPKQWQATMLLKFAIENWFVMPGKHCKVQDDIVRSINNIMELAPGFYWARLYNELFENDQTRIDVQQQSKSLWLFISLLHGAVQNSFYGQRPNMAEIDTLSSEFRQAYIGDTAAIVTMGQSKQLSELYITIKSIIEERPLWCETRPFYSRFFSSTKADIKNNNVPASIKLLQQTIAHLESPVAYQRGVSLFNDQFKLDVLKKLGSELKQKHMWSECNQLYRFCSGLANIDVHYPNGSISFFKQYLYHHSSLEANGPRNDAKNGNSL